MMVSIVVPVFDEADNVEPLARAIAAALPEGQRYEILFVDDGSRDSTLEVLRQLSREDSRIRYISFARNFGHQTALRAGIAEARGDCVIMMDGDFQHPPGEIPRLLAEFSRGFDIVSTRRVEPGPGEPGRVSFLKRTTSRLFYTFVNALGGVRIDRGSADFRLISRRARDVVVSMDERDLFLRGAFPWTGLPSVEIDYRPAPRRKGTTKYGFAKMLSLALDGITGFSVKPLRLTSFAGLGISAIGFAYAIYALVMRIFTSKTVEGWTSLLISVLIIGGIQLISLGIIGEYLGKLFMQSKGRPHYVIKEKSESTEVVSTTGEVS